MMFFTVAGTHLLETDTPLRCTSWAQGTRVEKVINELFEGRTYNYIECVDVDYTSKRVESFMDLQLDVKGCADVYASFDKVSFAWGYVS